jgi:hypothetical protein
MAFVLTPGAAVAVPGRPSASFRGDVALAPSPLDGILRDGFAR